MYLVGIDIGGTNLKIGLIRDDEIIDKIEQPTNSFDLIRQLVSVTFEIVEKKKNIFALGVDK